MGAGGSTGRLTARRAALLACAALALAWPAAETASAAFPFSRNATPSGYDDLWLNAGQVPGDLGGNTFKFAATPDPANTANNSNPVELGGVRGAHVVDADAGAETAFRTTTGRPDVTIAVLDSGIKWNDAGAMSDLRMKSRISRGEAPKPRNDGLATAHEPGEDCGSAGPYTHAGEWDLNGDGVFNLRDYSCDDRVATDTPKGVGPPGMFEPQDLLIAFSDGVDDDGNGYVDDLVGWDFLDDDNDPFDDVQYGHGTGEAKDSMAEADNGGEVGSCPNCMAVYLRVGDSFVADVNRFGAAVTYATDNGAQVVQEALGTLNNSSLARQAVDYAYRHGVTVTASAADEAAQHNNWPSSLPHVIVANSVTDGEGAVPNRSYLAFNGCTNFGAKITIAVPSTSCSSNAVGLAAGYAGLIYSAALNARDAGALDSYPDTSKCELVGGDPCPITPNEVRQLLASGSYGGVPQADDVDFAGSPPGSANEPACSPTPLPDCTSPYGPGGTLLDQVKANRQVFGAPVPSQSYPARRGFDQFYGYGRANVNRAVEALVDDPSGPSDATPPPEAEIAAPAWFAEIDPARASVDVSGTVYARGEPYRCSLEVAPGQYPSNALTTDTPAGDFAPVGGGWCDGSTVHGGGAAATAHDGVLGSIDVAALRQRFPAGTDFAGPTPTASVATGNGRPFFAPQAFTFRVVVAPTTGPARTGEDRRTAWLHRDRDLLNGFPRAVGRAGAVGGSESVPTADGASSPAFADLDGDNRNELVFADSNGFVHAITPDGDELPGWPVRGEEPGFVAAHDAAPAYSGGAVGTDLGGAILGAVAVGDSDGDGIPEVYAADAEGKVYGWAPDGSRVFTEQSDPDFSGRPLAPFVNVRDGKTNRTQHGFFGAPVLADLDGDGREEVIAAAMDRHVYAWSGEDSDPAAPGGAAAAPGYPVLVVDPAKVAAIDPATHAVTFRPDAGSFMQGAIIDTPAVGDITGDGVPEVVVGTNEEYDEPPNLGNPGGLGPLLGLFDPGNSRLYALQAGGGADADPLPTDALVPGWPFAPAMLMPETLPIVAEGIAGPPVIGPAACPSGGAGSKVGSATAVGPAYIVNGDGSPCYGSTAGKANALSPDFGGAAHATDTPLIPALGNPAFGAAAGADPDAPAFIAGAMGLFKALDLQLVDYQGGQDLLGVWDPTGGGLRDGFPATVNDLQLLTGPAVADIDGSPGEELLAGSASQDLVAYGPAGTPAAGWPKLTTDWTVATPLIGSFGTLDTKAAARKVVVGITRSGYVHAYRTDAPACSPSSSPRFHHDNANSGDYSRDAVLPGAPTGLRAEQGKLSFTAPGDDLLCGRADHYEIATAAERIDEAGFAAAKRLKAAPEPKAPGATQTLAVPAGSRGWIAIRAVDEQGNVGRVAAIKAKPPARPGRRCVNPIRGTSGPDVLRGTRRGDELTGRGGDDRIDGRGGADCLAGGTGNDRLRGGRRGDRLRGGRGHDRIRGGAGGDRIDAADGRRDRIRCGPGRDRVSADRKDRVAGSCERVRIGRS